MCWLTFGGSFYQTKAPVSLDYHRISTRNEQSNQVFFVKRPIMTSSETIMGSFIYTKEYNMVNDTNNGIEGATFLIAPIGCLIKTSMSFIKTKRSKILN